MNKAWKYGLLTLVLLTITTWISVLAKLDNRLHIVACDVGQGDGLLIFKGKVQILIDGGPSDKIQTCLERYIPFWDRTIEMIVLTNPDSDHYFGLIEVVKRYKVELFVANAIEKKGEEYKALTDEILSRSIPISNPLTGMQMKLEEINLDFIWPQPVAISAEYEKSRKSGVLGVYTSSRAINELSLVFNLKYGGFDALFTGDIVPESIDEVIQTGKISDVEYLKVPHHGSKNGLTKELLDAASPEVAVISNGAKNRYGHPSPEVIQMLESASVQTLRTDTNGDIEIVTDGQGWWVK